MAEAYPWGAQAPAARLTKLQRDLERNGQARERYLETHKTKMAEFDETDKTLKGDIRVCEGILEKETREQASNQMAKLLQRLAGSGKIDIQALVSDPNLEQKLMELSAPSDAPAKPKAAPKKAEKADPAKKPEAAGESEG